MRGYERKCPVCGRTFYIGKADEWAYRIRKQVRGKKYRKMFCSNKCMTAWLQEVENDQH